MKKFCLGFLLVASIVSLSAQKKVVGYYPSWSKGSYSHTKIDYKHLTHIAHAFIFPYEDGSLDVSTFSLYSALISTAHQNGVKVVISVGGWDGVRTPRFSTMSADTAARRKFVNNVVQFVLTNNYDGIDLDWEYPKTTADKSNMKLLVHDLRVALDATGKELSLSMAGPATSWSGQWFDFAAMKNDFDWIGIMTYDFYGAWTSKAGPNSALYGNWSKNTEGWIDYSFSYYNATRGIPKEKILIGIPFYGQVFNATSMYGTSTGGSQSIYTNVASKIGVGWTRYWDSESQVPYLVNAASTQVISYDDSQSVALKCAYVNSKGGGGAIIWAIGQDQYQGKTPLLETVGSLLKNVSAVEEMSSPFPNSFALMQNYPNPFNPETTIGFTVPASGFTTLKVHDLLGREVATVLNEQKSSGTYTVHFDAHNLLSGVYFYRLTQNNISITRSMIVLR